MIIIFVSHQPKSTPKTENTDVMSEMASLLVSNIVHKTQHVHVHV